MSLSQQIDADLKQAMRDKAADKLSVLRMLKSAVKYAAIEKSSSAEPSDADVLAAIRKEMKKREDSIASYEKANRPDLASKEKTEAEILSAYLPAQLSHDAVQKIVEDAIAETGATSKKQMGTVMKLAQSKAAGQTDNKTLSSIVQKLLPS